MTIPFIRYSKLWIVIASVTVVASIVVVAVWRLKPGIDFTGGSLLELSFANGRPSTEQIKESFDKLAIHDATLQKVDEEGMIVRSRFLTEEEHQKVLTDLRQQFTDNGLKEERFETVGAAVSKQLRSRAIWAVILVNAGIIAYVAYAFRKVSRPIASWKYGLLAIVALIHDVLLVIGVFSILGHVKGVEVDIAFVVALLTVLGYSVNDTIVVYDRIRENLLRHNTGDFAEVVNTGLNDTLMRSLNTTLTALVPLFALYFIGGETIHNFALALIIGMASGAYSSIFIASPLLVLVYRWQQRRRAA